MGVLFQVSAEEMVELRNRIFTERGVPNLLLNGYEKAPFSSSWNGKEDFGGYNYEFCRLREGYLEFLHIYITKGDSWIEMQLNVFEIHPPITFMEELQEISHIKYILPPAVRTSMRLRFDDYIWIPIITPFCFRKHKIGRFFTRWGLNREVKKLEHLIAKDMAHINAFVSRWHELHIPYRMDREGNIIEK